MTHRQRQVLSSLRPSSIAGKAASPGRLRATPARRRRRAPATPATAPPAGRSPARALRRITNLPGRRPPASGVAFVRGTRRDNAAKKSQLARAAQAGYGVARLTRRQRTRPPFPFSFPCTRTSCPRRAMVDDGPGGEGEGEGCRGALDSSEARYHHHQPRRPGTGIVWFSLVFLVHTS